MSLARAAGSLIAPLLIGALGGTGALVACGAAVLAYGLVVLRGPQAKPELSPAEDTLISSEPDEGKVAV